MSHHGRTVAKALGLSGELAKQAEDLVTSIRRSSSATSSGPVFFGLSSIWLTFKIR
jgi:hypothetical protein